MNERITIDTQDGSFGAYVAKPATTPAPAIVVIQEIFGINADLRATCDELASQGFIAICPDLFWRMQPGVELTDQSEEEWKKAFAFYEAFDVNKGVEDVGATLQAARGYAGANGKVGVMGFCLGGKFAYLASTRLPIDAAVSYYGVHIDQHLDEAGKRGCPILMQFASDDPHVPEATVAAIRARMEGEAGVDIHVYPGTEHGFNRQGYPPFNEAAAREARRRTVALLRDCLA
jgi:carboxymethylenebutenolidase